MSNVNYKQLYAIKECKELSLLIGNLIGKSERIEVENNGKLERWQTV